MAPVSNTTPILAAEKVSAILANSMKKFIRALFENTSTKQTILKNTVWVYGSNIVIKALRLLLFFYTARIFEPEKYGVFTYTLSLIGLFYLCSDAGISLLLIREYHKDDNTRRLGVLSSLKYGLLLIVTVSATVFYFFLKDPSVREVYLILLAMSLALTTRDFIGSFSRAANRLELESLALIVDSAITACLGFFVLAFTPTLTHFSYAYLFGALLSLLFILVASRKLLPRLVMPTWSEAHATFSVSVPILFVGIISFLLSEIDFIMLKLMKGADSVGNYAVAYKLARNIATFPLLFTAILYPLFSQQSSNISALSHMIRRSLSPMLILAIPITIGSIALAAQFFELIFGSAYMASVPIFQVLMAITPLYIISDVLVWVLLALNLQNQNLKFAAVAAVTNIALNALLIPPWNETGGALATATSQIINLTLIYRLSVKALSSHVIDKRTIVNALVGSVTMVVIGFLISLISHSVALIILASSLAYLACLYILREDGLVYIFSEMERVKKIICLR